jgi:NodT family efflux transporter outer membrane factor (OMF) lipoprotein
MEQGEALKSAFSICIILSKIRLLQNLKLLYTSHFNFASNYFRGARVANKTGKSSRSSGSRLSVLASALVFAGLAGCAVGPEYKAPELSLPAKYHNEAGLDAHNARSGNAAAPQLDTWWNGFNDPVLLRIVNRVLVQNLDLEAAVARIEQAWAGAKAAGARKLPSGSLNASAVRQRQSLESPAGRIASTFPGYDRNQSIYDIGVGASWELDLAGGLHSASRAADAEVQAAEADRLGVRVSVAAEAADAYFRVRGAQRRIAIAQEQIGTNERLLKLVQLRVQDGLAASRELAQAQAQVSQAKATVPPLRIELEVQLNRLDVLVGEQPGTYAAELAEPGADTTLPAISLAQGPVDLLRRRPDVIAAERRLAASNDRIGAAMAEYYPNVTLSAVLGLSSLGSSGLFTAAAFQPQSGAGLHWRLFDFGRVDAEVEHATGAKAEALAAYRKSLLRATEDVENSVVTLVQLEQQHEDLASEVEAHTRARDASEEAYKGGAVGLYEVLQEDRQLLAARDTMARVHTDNGRAVVATFRALGGGW